MSDKSKNRYWYRSNNNLCVLCGSSRDNSTKFCTKCKERKARLWDDRYMRLISEGKCTKCKIPSNGVHCATCAYKQLIRNRNKLNRLKTEVFGHYGGASCACLGCSWHSNQCSVSALDVLTVNHMNGGGNEHRREINQDDSLEAGVRTYRWLKLNEYPAGFNILCFNCNWAQYKTGVLERAQLLSNSSIIIE